MTAAPTNVQPPNLGLVLTDYPEMKAVVGYGAAGASETVTVTWQVAQNTGFSTNLKSLTTTKKYVSGETAVQGLGTPLTTGVWYVRARSTDNAAVQSAYSTTQSFTVDHRPFASPESPFQSEKITYGTGIARFRWTFGDTDPSDVQTAYQVRAYIASTDVLLFDSGKVVSAADFLDQTIPSANNNGFFYWQVKVWDRYDIASPWSQQVLFQIGTEPTAVITSPINNATVTTPGPKIIWQFVSGNLQPTTYANLASTYATYTALQSGNASYTVLLNASGQQALQAAYRVVLYQGPYTVHDSGWIAGTASEYIMPAVVHHGLKYQAIVSVRDAAGYEGSNVSTVYFSGAWTAPDSPAGVVVDASLVDDPFVGGVQITWNAEVADPTFTKWRVYRRISGILAWDLVGSSDARTGRGEVIDYLFESGVTYEYSVSQVAIRYFNEETESILGSYSVTPESTKYWLIHSTDPTQNVMIGHVTGDSYSEEYEEHVGQIIGRGRRKEIGTRFGYAGSLSVKVRDLDSRGSSLELEQYTAFRAARIDAFLRVPFGHIWKVALGNISVEREAGVGRREFASVTIPYEEVA